MPTFSRLHPPPPKLSDLGAYEPAGSGAGAAIRAAATLKRLASGLRTTGVMR